jgi:BASS family bile acid:Na+ symporter
MSVAPDRDRLLRIITSLFPVYVVLGSLLAATCPSIFAFFKREYISPTLSLIMLAMGLTLSMEDFAAILRTPGMVLWGALAQYSIMPLLGWWISRYFGLPPAYAIGVLLVSSCPGGTASNLVCYLAGANVALSVLMTTTTTQAAMVMTPLLMKVMAGTIMPIDAIGIFRSMLQVVFLPLALGMFLNSVPASRAIVKRFLPWFPLISVIGVVLINASIISGNIHAIKTGGLRLFMALLLLHGFGLLLGYGVSRLRYRDKNVNRAVAIEVCMQNSGLGAALAQAHFADPQVAVPAAISASMHSVLGSLAAGFWRWGDAQHHKRPSIRRS